MATIQKATAIAGGGTITHRATYTVENTSSTATTVTLTKVEVKYSTSSSYFPFGLGALTITCDGTALYTKAKDSATVYSGTAWKTVATPNTTKTFTRGKSAASKTIAISYNSAAASTTITIPAKPSYKVTLNANGGTGGTASLTKWYGETLSLTSGFTAPTRTGWKFIGWGTSSTATTTESTYTGNSAATRYAVWERQITGITLNVTTLRVENGTATAEADEGTWCYGTCSYSVSGAAAADVSFTVSVSPSGPSIQTSSFTATKSVDATLTGSFEFRASGCLTDSSYTFTVAASAANTSATQADVTKSQGNVLSVAYFTMDVLGNAYWNRDTQTGERPGHGISFGMPCTEEGFHVGMEARLYDHIRFQANDDHYFIFENTDTSKPEITHWRFTMTGYGNFRLDSSSDGGATWTGGVKYFLSDATSLVTTTNVSTILTAGSGWTVSSATFRKWGNHVGQLYFSASKSSAISVPASGDVGNEAVATLNEGFRPATSVFWMSLTGPGYWGTCDAGGTVQLTATNGYGTAKTIAANTAITFRTPAFLMA